MSYATTSELVEYLGVNEADLPDDASRLLERASEFMDYVTRNGIDESEADQAESARKATCAQVEYWQELGGDELGLMSKINTISIGKFSMSGGSGDGSDIAQLADRSQHYLFLEGLLYSGVDSR